MLAMQAMEKFATKSPRQWRSRVFMLMYMSYLMLIRTPNFSNGLRDFLKKKIVLDLIMGYCVEMSNLDS